MKVEFEFRCYLGAPEYASEKSHMFNIDPVWWHDEIVILDILGNRFTDSGAVSTLSTVVRMRRTRPLSSPG